jgi:hypothetical protein
MDINYYLYREQIERSRSGSATSSSARDSHLGLADSYRRLLDHQRDLAVRAAAARAH